MGDGMKRAKAATKGPTKAQRAALVSAMGDKGGQWIPVGTSQRRMADAMDAAGWGFFAPMAGAFTINAAGRAAAKHGEG